MRGAGRIHLIPSVALALFTARAVAQEIEVTGQLKLEAFYEEGEHGLRIVGQLVDELAQPVVGATVTVSRDAQHSPVTIRGCDARIGSNEVQPTQLLTDQRGEFCGWVDSLESNVVVSATATHFPVVHSRAISDQLALRPPRFAHVPPFLDKQSSDISVVEIMSSIGSQSGERSAQLTLFLSCDTEKRELGSLRFQGSYLGRFEIVAQDWMRPGVCELEAQVSSAGLTSAVQAHELLVRAPVHLRVSDLNIRDDEVDVNLIAAPDDGVDAEIPQGIVEVDWGDGERTTFPLSARGDVRFNVQTMDVERRARVRYISAQPHWIGGQDLLLDIPRRAPGPSMWPAHLLWLLAFACWVAYSWFRSSRGPKNKISPKRAVSAQVTTTGKSSGPFGGVVVDGNTGEPIDGVLVQLEEVRTGERVLRELGQTNEHGMFSLTSNAHAHQLLRMRFTHSRYVTLQAPVQGTDVHVSMQANRRAAVERFHKWATTSGLFFNVAAKPTVGQVAQLAQQSGQDQVALWAEEVAILAYGPLTPTEQDLEDLGHAPPVKTRL